MEFYAASIDPLSHLASVPVADRLAGLGSLGRILPPSLAARWKAELEAAYVQETTPAWSELDPQVALARLRVKLALGKREDVAAGLAQLEETHRNLPQLNLVRQQMEDLRKAVE